MALLTIIIIILYVAEIKMWGQSGNLLEAKLDWCLGMHIEVARYNISLTLNSTYTVCDAYLPVTWFSL